MNLRIEWWALVGALALASCTSAPELRSELGTPAEAPPPSWIEHPPVLPGYRFYVGESLGLRSREDSLERAWVSAFVRIGMTEFPELASISSESTESMKRASFRRHFALRLEKVRWNGIREAGEYGSPYVGRDARTGRYIVYRLLKWKNKDLEMARARLRKQGADTQLPNPPEETRQEEERLVNAVQAIQELNQRLDRRNQLLDRVFSKTRCGITVSDLVHILGSPDRTNPFNESVFEKEYFWGQYKVERLGDDPTVTSVTREDGKSRRRILCRGRSESSSEAD